MKSSRFRSADFLKANPSIPKNRRYGTMLPSGVCAPIVAFAFCVEAVCSDAVLGVFRCFYLAQKGTPIMTPLPLCHNAD